MPVKYLWIAIILFCLTFYFYSIESFVSSINATKFNIREDLPVTRIEIVFAKEYDNDAYINLSELRILDDHNQIVKYWESPNSVHFEGGDKGYQGTVGPIKNLYDDEPSTFAHSTNAPDKLTVLLNSGIKVASISLKNRSDCCEKRIQKYDMALYSGENQIGLKSLSDLGEKGKWIVYDIIPPISGNKEPTVSTPVGPPVTQPGYMSNGPDPITYPTNIPTPMDTNIADTNPMDRINLPKCANSIPTDLDKVSKACDYTIPGGPDGTHRVKKPEPEGFSLF
jgi:hypothetical protein